MRALRFGLILGILLSLMILPMVTAQDDDQPTLSSISYDEIVQDTITEDAFFDRWSFTGAQGDVVVAFMTASNGLAPLLGIGTTGGDLLTASDGRFEGEPVNAAPDSQIELEYTLPESGEFVLIATRAGNQEGTTTGSYTLQIRRANFDGGSGDAYQDVVFRCGEEEVTTAATFQWTQELNENFRVSVYGLDGFQPLIRVEAGQQGEINDCAVDSQAMGGDQFTLPGEATITLPAESPPGAAQYGLSGDIEDVTLTIGSIDGAAGRYLILIEGFTISPALDDDAFVARIGPLAAATTDLLVYMVKNGTSRLDPTLTLIDVEDNILATCDDAGRRGCEDVPALIGAGVTLSDGTVITGSRLDAGLRLMPGNPDPLLLQFSSRTPAEGNYAILIMGTLPPRPEGQ